MLMQDTMRLRDTGLRGGEKGRWLDSSSFIMRRVSSLSVPLCALVGLSPGSNQFNAEWSFDPHVEMLAHFPDKTPTTERWPQIDTLQFAMFACLYAMFDKTTTSNHHQQVCHPGPMFCVCWASVQTPRQRALSLPDTGGATLRRSSRAPEPGKNVCQGAVKPLCWPKTSLSR